jgi:hypothetical protein
VPVCRQLISAELQRSGADYPITMAQHALQLPICFPDGFFASAILLRSDPKRFIGQRDAIWSSHRRTSVPLAAARANGLAKLTLLRPQLPCRLTGGLLDSMSRSPDQTLKVRRIAPVAAIHSARRSCRKRTSVQVVAIRMRRRLAPGQADPRPALDPKQTPGTSAPGSRRTRSAHRDR